MMAGVNISIQVALFVEVIDIFLGVTIGTLAGFFGGWADTGLARFTDIMFAFPGLLLVIMAAATLGPTATKQFGLIGRLLVVAVMIGITIWPVMARFVRGQTLQIKEQQYMEAARTVGGTNRQLILRHIVPNLFSIVIAVATLNMVGAITTEAVISLLGLGRSASWFQPRPDDQRWSGQYHDLSNRGRSSRRSCWSPRRLFRLPR